MPELDPNHIIIGLAGAAAVLIMLTIVVAWNSRAHGQRLAAQLHDTSARLAAAQAEIHGRLGQMAEQQAAQSHALGRTLEDRLGFVSRRVGDSLREQSDRSQATLDTLRERLAVIDSAQKNITTLSSQVVGLQDILSNKQARGAFGEVQLEDIVRSALPPSAYRFQATVGDGRRADCLLTLPDPPGLIALDAKFPLESYRALRAADTPAQRTAARRGFAADVLKHVNDIAQRYIVAGETADSALMFLPSEAVYAELHANFGDVVERSYRAKVWIVSPTTLMATLNTVRAVMRDVHIHQQAGAIHREIQKMIDDVGRLDDRVAKLQSHFAQAADDIDKVRISTDKVGRRAARIIDVELADALAEPAADTQLSPPTPMLTKAAEGA